MWLALSYETAIVESMNAPENVEEMLGYIGSEQQLAEARKSGNEHPSGPRGKKIEAQKFLVDELFASAERKRTLRARDVRVLRSGAHL